MKLCMIYTQEQVLLHSLFRKKQKKVIGVESVPDAIKMRKRTQ
jgi:hypothetical protein